MRVYHRTYHADAIEREGFRDGSYVMPGIGELRGVFVSADWPLDENEGADGDVVLALEIEESLFVEYEHFDDDNPYREAMIPARALNATIGTLRRLSEDELDELTIARQDAWARLLDSRPAGPGLEGNLAGFRFELRTPDGDDAGTFVTAVPNWDAGMTFTTGDGRKLRIVRIVPLDLIDEFADSPVYGLWEVEPVSVGP